MKQRLFTLPFFVFVLINTLYSQGIVTGKVTDSKTGEALYGAQVLLEGTTLGSETDTSGRFNITNVQPGTYNVIFHYLGYENKTISTLTIKSNETQTVNTTLGTKEEVLKTVTLTGQKTRNTENAVVAEIKNATSIVSGVSAAQIQKSQDRSAADVVKRIPGVTVVEGRFINIRGLNERYNNVWVNDAGAPSTEADKRAFSFDAIPAGMIERILIYKTPSPELPGDFAGGMVKIYTQSMPDKNSITAGYSVSFREGSVFKPTYSTEGSKTDALGFDNGYRSIPANSPGYISKNDSNINNITKAFKNNWGIKTAQAIPDQRANLTLQGVLHRKNVTIGNTTALFYTSTTTTNFVQRADYDSTTKNTSLSDTVSTHQVNVGIMENLAFKFGNNTIEVKNLLNQTGIQQTTMRGNYFEDVNKRFFGEYYQARTTLLSQLAGKHKFNNDNSTYDWNFTYNYGLRNEPDFKRIGFTYNTADSLYKAQIANVVDPVNGGGRFFARLKEQSYTLNHNYKQHVALKKYTFDFSVGNFIEYKSREFSARILGYTITPGQNAYNLTQLPLAQLFGPTNIGENTKFKIDEITNKSDAYKAQNLQAAGYFRFDLPIGTRVKLITGLRYEYNKQSLQSFLNQDSIHPSITTNFFLPSANLSVSINKKMLMRFAYGETVNRPEFREWSPFYFYDFQFNAGNYGSLFPTVYYPNGYVLKVAQIHNLDVRYEWYPEYGDLVHVGAFFKYFKDPIQQVITATGGSDSKAFTYINGEKALVYGLEIDLKKNLGFLGRSNRSKNVMQSFALVLNAAYINSQLTLPPLTSLVTTTKLQGQSPYVVNAGVYYQNDSIGLQASLLYNVFGPRIYAIGNTSYGNIGEMSKNSLDLSISKTFFKRLTVTFAIQDLINQANKLVLDINRNNKFENKGMDQPIMSYKSGRYYTLGLKFKL